MEAPNGRLGLSIRKHTDHFVLYQVEPGSAAERGGVQTGDVLVCVEEIHVSDWTLDEVIQLMKGEPGTWIRLTLMRRTRGREVHTLNVMLQREPAYMHQRQPLQQQPQRQPPYQQQNHYARAPYSPSGHGTAGSPSNHIGMTANHGGRDYDRRHSPNAIVFGAKGQPATAAKHLHQNGVQHHGVAGNPYTTSHAQGVDRLQDQVERLHLRSQTNGNGASAATSGYSASNMSSGMEFQGLAGSLAQSWIHVADERPPSAPSFNRQSSLSNGSFLPMQGGTVGLVNLGNTCFFNSIVQCLLHSIPFASYVIFNLETEMNGAAAITGSEGQEEKKEESELVKAFKHLCGHVWSGEHSKPIEPRTLLNALKKDQRCRGLFNFKQQDAHECLCLLLDALHQDTNGMVQSESPSPPTETTLPKTIMAQPMKGSYPPPEDTDWDFVQGHGKGESHDPATNKASEESSDATKVDSIVSKFMGGRLATEVRCKKCGYSTQNQQSFFTLSMPIPSRARGEPQREVTLEECFKMMESEETSVDWVCDKCKHADASKRMWIVSHPKVMIVHLERFGHSNGRRFKRDDPLFLPMTNFVRLDRPVAQSVHVGATLGNHYLYDLVAWTEHLGASDSSGHYVAYAKHLDNKMRRYSVPSCFCNI